MNLWRKVMPPSSCFVYRYKLMAGMTQLVVINFLCRFHPFLTTQWMVLVLGIRQQHHGQGATCGDNGCQVQRGVDSKDKSSSFVV